jgi:hypothetical protein
LIWNQRKILTREKEFIKDGAIKTIISWLLF